MRKAICLLLVLVGCLLLAGRTMPRADRTARAAVALSVDRAAAEQWLCERSHNSDLNLPRIPCGLAAPQSRVVCSRGPAYPVRAPFRCVSGPCPAGVVKITSPFGSTRPVAVTHAVDYYVYRLRRLII